MDMEDSCNEDEVVITDETEDDIEVVNIQHNINHYWQELFDCNSALSSNCDSLEWWKASKVKFPSL